jgi:hypothetical protein
VLGEKKPSELLERRSRLDRSVCQGLFVVSAAEVKNCRNPITLGACGYVISNRHEKNSSKRLMSGWCRFLVEDSLTLGTTRGAVESNLFAEPPAKVALSLPSPETERKVDV